MEISGNLSKQLFTTGSSRTTLKICLRDYFQLLKSPHLGCWFLDVLIRRFLLYKFLAIFLPESFPVSRLTLLQPGFFDFL